MTRGVTFVITLTMAAVPCHAGAQSLAAIAQQTAHGGSARTYTNADLLPTGAATAPDVNGQGTPAAQASPTESTPAASEPRSPEPGAIIEEYAGSGRVNTVMRVEKSSSSENEPYWRKVTKSVKDRLATAEAQLAMVMQRLGTAAGGDREALTQLEAKLRRDIESINAESLGHQKRAKALGVPAEWLR